MSDDLIKRSDALSAAGDMSYIAFEIRKKLQMIPSADAPYKVLAHIDLDPDEVADRMKHLQIEVNPVEGKWEVDAIDRDALIDYCLKLIDVERKQGSDVMNYGQERVNQTEAIIDYIEHMPHVYADRPHGEWIDRGMRVPSSWVKKCSLCGHETDTWRWCKFCPNCGAKMSNASNASNTLETLEEGETE